MTVCTYCGKQPPEYHDYENCARLRHNIIVELRRQLQKAKEAGYAYDRIREQFFPIQAERDELQRRLAAAEKLLVERSNHGAQMAVELLNTGLRLDEVQDRIEELEALQH